MRRGGGCALDPFHGRHGRILSLTSLLLLLSFALLPLRCFAQELYPEEGDVFHLASMQTGLSEEEQAIGGKLSPTEVYDVEGGLRRLLRSLKTRIQGELRENLRFAASLTALAAFGGFACALCEEGKLRTLLEICVCCTAATILTGSMDSLIRQTNEAIYRLSDYSKAALPVVFTAAAASGAASAASRYAAVSFALDVLMSLSQRMILPLIHAYLALTLSGALFPNAMLKAVTKLLRWAAGILMTGTSLAFTAYLGMTGAISTAVNSAAVKATKTLISTALPVVGGMISDASAMVLSAAGIVRSCSGAFGLISVCAICLGPFVLLTVRMLLFKAVAVLAEAVPCGRLPALLGGLSDAAALLMGMLGSCALMLFLSFTLAMKAVTAG